MSQIVYRGIITTKEDKNEYDAIYVGEDDEPFVQMWEESFHTKQQVTVRYWISDSELTREELKENQLLAISGAVYADYGARYSELTGYLWTDEKLNVGGHDLLDELESNKGKFLYMEVDYSQSK
jgi:hypothetical protein